MHPVALVRACEEQSLERGAERREVDWADPGGVGSCLRDLCPSLVIHCAGASARGTQSVADIYDANVTLSAGLLEAVEAACPGAGVVLLSSAAVYGPAAPSPTAETAPPDPRSHYAASKVAAELLTTVFAVRSGLRCAVARPFNVVGPGEPAGSVVSDLAAQVFAEPAGSVVEVTLREVSSTRDFVDVRDVAEALLDIAGTGRPGEAYNVCTGAGTSISRLVKEAGRVWGREIEVTLADPGAQGTASTGDAAKLRALGWAPRRSLADSLESVMADFVRRA